jgi:hypothetical protein
MSVTIIVEITSKLLRYVSTHEVSSSGSSLVLAKITYECIENVQVVRLKFVKKFIKLIKIANYICGRICNPTVVMLLWCALSVYTQQQL